MISAAGAAGVGYYSGGGGSEEARDASGRNYYTGASDHGERPGQWSGRLASALGLEGSVDAKIMESVYERFMTPDGQPIGSGPRNYMTVEARLSVALEREPDALPERVEELRTQIELSDQRTCRGIDLTFSVPKSYTVGYVAAWRAAEEANSVGATDRAVGFGNLRETIDAAILAANQDAMDYVASVATIRTGRHGHGYAGQWVGSPGLVIASFPQLTSRADDPQYHVHNVVLNRAQTEDGKIGALDTRDLGQQRHGYSAVADRMAAEYLQDAGIKVAMRPDGMAREIVGIDQETLDAYSQRRAQITKAMAPVVREQEERLGRGLNNLEKSRLAQTINLATREAKGKGDIEWSAMLDRWQDQITDAIGAGLLPIAERVKGMVEDGASSAPARSFSPAAVIAQAVHELAQEKAAWNRADALLAVDRALPDRLGLGAERTVALLDGLTDQLLASEGVVQVGGNRGVIPPADLVPGTFVRPSEALFAAPETMEAENLILRAAREQRGHSLDPGAVNTWLDQNYPTIGADQRAAVVGLASTGVALAQLVGPAGTGKSFTVGALAGAWSDLSDGGRVIGLAVSQVATEVLREDGVPLSFNVAAWQAMQGRLDSGRVRGDEIELGPRDIVVIDEASMIGTMALDRVRAAVEASGGRSIATGDHRQLGAVGTGGTMGLLADNAETYTLTDVRRFESGWEGKASLGLRNGDIEALKEYDVHGRLVEVDTLEDAIQSAARAAAAERIAGRSVSVTAATNEDAYRIADLVREHLVAAGLVEEEGIILARTDGVAGIGDQIMTRQIDHSLGVLNGSRFTVTAVDEDGGLSVVDDDGVLHDLPGTYVSQHVQHGYASTVHGSQGKTVDVGFVVTDGRSSAASLYVGMTRGQQRNTAFVAMQPTVPTQGRLNAGNLKVTDPEGKPSAVSVLAASLEQESDSRAALSVQQADIAKNASIDTILSRVEEVTHLACRGRLENDLDRLAEEGILSMEDRVALASDQSTDHLSRICRAGEQSGLNPQDLLREAIGARSLTGANSVAQVIAGRIVVAHDVMSARPETSRVPSRVSDAAATYLDTLHEQISDRTHALGSQVAQDAPTWALNALGPVPDDALNRLEWESHAGCVAAYREAKGVASEDERVIPSAPGLSQPEARSAWWGAWEALGRPQETREEAAMTDGALRSRVSAWEREQQWAPAHANAALRAAEMDAAEARHGAILARAAGDDETADRLEAQAQERAAVADAMAVVATARGEWAEQVAVTQDLAERASIELRGRGLELNHEPDRVGFDEWLNHQREIDVNDEAEREIGELDVPLADEAEVETATRSPEDGRGPQVESRVGQEAGTEDQTVHEAQAPSEAGSSAEIDTPQSGDYMGPSSGDVHEESASEAVADATTGEDDVKTSHVASSPAHEVAPMELEDAEIHAIVAVAHDAQDRIADRESEEAAHSAMTAEEEAEASGDDEWTAEAAVAVMVD